MANAIIETRSELLANRYGPASFSNRRFRVSWRGYFWPVLCVALACFMLIDTRGTKYQGWFTFGLAYVALLGGVYLVQANVRSTVSIEGGIVKYIQGGRERWNVSLEDILGVRIYQGSFYIRARWRVDERIALPMHFAQAPLLLAPLRNFRPKETASAQD
jgi:hypothetical protein